MAPPDETGVERSARMRRICGIVAVVALSVACSGGGGGAGGGAGVSGATCGTAVSPNACVDGCNPCTRLSDAQVTAVVGQPAQGKWNGDVCEWDFDDAQGNLSLGVSLGVNLNFSTFEDLCHPAVVDGGVATVTPVGGVGDDGCYLTTSAGALGSFELDFLKGCWAYSVSIVGPIGQGPPFSDATVQADEKALALDAVPNL
jgi:hypothetical protein